MVLGSAFFQAMEEYDANRSTNRKYGRVFLISFKTFGPTEANESKKLIKYSLCVKISMPKANESNVQINRLNNSIHCTLCSSYYGFS